MLHKRNLLILTIFLGILAEVSLDAGVEVIEMFSFMHQVEQLVANHSRVENSSLALQGEEYDNHTNNMSSTLLRPLSEVDDDDDDEDYEPFSPLDFDELSEFLHGQEALMGEPCDRKAYEAVVDPIIQNVIDQDEGRKTNRSWLVLQMEYAHMMTQDLTLRARTCHASHLMQCSPDKKADGNHVCECLHRPPQYKMALDVGMGECRALPYNRCYSPLGFKCGKSHDCVEGLGGKCYCANRLELANVVSCGTGMEVDSQQKMLAYSHSSRKRRQLLRR